MPSLRSKIVAIPFAREAYRGLVKFVHRCGAPAIWRSLSGRRHVILIFHRVRPAGQPADPFDTCPSVSVDVFRQVLEHLCERFAVVSLRELCDRRAEKEPLAAVTFDDGWRDNYDLAFPVLRELGIPATIFVTTDKIGGSEPFWRQVLGRMFHVAGACPDGEASRDLRAVLGLGNGRPLTPELYRDTVARWKRLKPAEIMDLLFRAGWTGGKGDGYILPEKPEGGHRRAALVAAQNGPSPFSARLFLDAAEIREMAAAGITFGSHTVTHAILPQLSSSEIECELNDSRVTLESLLNDRIDALAYPDGKYSAEVLQCARAAGYRVGCTTRSRWLSGSISPICLPRIEPPFYSCNGVHKRRKIQFSDVRTARAKAATQCSSTGKIKILFLIDEFVASYGGTEQHLLFLLRTLPLRSVEPHFAVLSGICRCDPNSFPVQPLILSEGCPRGPIGFCRRVQRLTRLITARQIDVIHAFCPISEIAALIATRLARRGKVLGVRRNIGYWHTFWTLWRARLVRFLGAQYVANCNAAREFSAAMELIPRARISVIHNPVVVERLEQGLAQVSERAAIGIRNGDLVVGMVATVRPIKDHATFLRSARLVTDRFPTTKFVIVGHFTQEYLAEMQTLAADLQIESRVLWLGAVQNPFSLLPHFDVGVLSSLSEGFSNALLEYSAAGIPTVATDVGGTREIVIDGQTGFLVPPRSPELMADRICQLLHDGGLRQVFGSRAAARARTLFSEESVLNQYTQLYQRLAGKNGAAAK